MAKQVLTLNLHGYSIAVPKSGTFEVPVHIAQEAGRIPAVGERVRIKHRTRGPNGGRRPRVCKARYVRYVVGVDVDGNPDSRLEFRRG